MRVKASTVEAHAFAPARRGYDTEEVDNAMQRIAATLRTYEEELPRLEARVSEAEEAHEAVRRTFLSAQRTKDEMIGEARVEANRLVAEAEDLLRESRDESASVLAHTRAESERILAESEAASEQRTARSIAEAAARLESATSEASELLAHATARSQALLEHAAAEAAALAAAARADADRIVTDAQGTAERLVATAEHDAGDLQQTAQREADVMITDAREAAETATAEASNEARRTLDEAEAEADRIRLGATGAAEDLLREARDELGRLHARLPQLRSAVRSIERRLHDLAAEALEEVGSVEILIDLTSDEVTALDGSSGGTDVERDEHRDEPETSPIPNEEVPAPPLAGRAAPGFAAAALMPPPQTAEATDAPSTDTFYQRRGRGLRRRIAVQRRLRNENGF